MFFLSIRLNIIGANFLNLASTLDEDVLINLFYLLNFLKKIENKFLDFLLVSKLIVLYLYFLHFII